MHTLVLFKDEQDFARANVKTGMKVPFIIITAKNDELVRNSDSFEIYQMNKNPKNKFVEFDNADHLTISHDLDQVQELVQSIVTYFDGLLQQ